MTNEHGLDVEKVVPGDPVEEEQEELEEGFEDLERFFVGEDDDDDEPTEEEVEEQVEEDQQIEETVEEAKTEERLFTQEELNQIIGTSRIQGRELTDKVEILQHMTGGMNIDQIIEHLRSQQAEEYETDYGLPREKAVRIVDAESENRYLKSALNELYGQQQQTAAMASYNNEKSRFISNPLVKRYEKDIDAVSQGGQRLGFEAAMKYVLGEKAYAGDLTKNIQESAEQRAIKNAAKKPKVTPEGAGSGGAPSNSIPPDLKRMAQMFGNDPKSVAAQYQKMQRTPR